MADHVRRFRVTSVLAAAVAIACVACARAPAGLTRVTMAVGGQSQLVYLPITLARELGYYRDERLEVDIQDFAGGSKALEALLGGSAEVVSGFYDHTIQMAAEGRNLVAFVTMLRSPGLVLAVAPGAADTVRRVEDLEGRLVGVTAAGSTSHHLLMALLARHGVSAEAVSITSVGTSATAIAALEHGTVAAAMMTDPAFTLAVRRNPAVRALVDLRQAADVREAFGASMYPASVLYSTGAWVGGHRETAARLARAVTRTLAWMQAHPAEEIAARMPAAFRGGDDALYVDALRHSMAMFSPDGVMSADGATAVQTLLSQSMDTVRAAHIDLSKTYTNEFVAGATR